MAATPRHAPAVVGSSTGQRIAAVSSTIFGRPMMPWQRVCANVIGAHNNDGSPTWPIVVITVQRQAGKTALLKAVITDRCLFGSPSARVWYTAQNGKYARDMWGETVRELSVASSPLAGYVSARWSQGAEIATFPDGSSFSPFAPTRDALHGKQSDLAVIDEAWRHDAVRGAELMQAINPTMATRPAAQLVIVSTAGTADSAYLRGWVERGRAGAPGIGYLEWGIGDTGDPTDLDAVIAAHPAVGYTITAEYLRAQADQNPPSDYARAFGNAWTRTAAYAIPPAQWASAAADVTVDRTAPFILAADVAIDRSRAAIVAAGDGVIEVVTSEPGHDWLVPRLLHLADRYRPAGIVIDRAGPAGPAADAIALSGIDLLPLTSMDISIATGTILDAIAAGTLRYRPHPALDDAVANAALRTTGDGGRRWTRRHAGGPICELWAATLAHWAYARRPSPVVQPMMIGLAG